MPVDKAFAQDDPARQVTDEVICRTAGRRHRYYRVLFIGDRPFQVYSRYLYGSPGMWRERFLWNWHHTKMSVYVACAIRAAQSHRGLVSGEQGGGNGPLAQ